MSEHDQTCSGTSSSAPTNRRRLLAGLLTGGVLGGLLGASLTAWSNQGGPGGWHGGGRWCRTAMSPEAERERMEFAADWMLNKIQASDAQREQVKAILAQTLQDLAPLRDQHRRHREAFLAAMMQPSVDRAALEELRRSELQLAETASGRILTALADAAEVLTPEQRAELVRMAREFRH
jgi:Spy/CpxP family protein refolding chaperone